MNLAELEQTAEMMWRIWPYLMLAANVGNLAGIGWYARGGNWAGAVCCAGAALLVVLGCLHVLRNR